jgi:hypothetical protein
MFPGRQILGHRVAGRGVYNEPNAKLGANAQLSAMAGDPLANHREVVADDAGGQTEAASKFVSGHGFG